MKCLESANFWSNINKNKLFWNVFISFAEDMQNRLRKKNQLISHKIKF
jgi:hypothetical protein